MKVSNHMIYYRERSKDLFNLIGFLGIVGMLLSIYLTLVSNPKFCNITSFFSCDKVLNSSYSKFFGLPTAFLGVIWFTVVSSLSFLDKREKPLIVFLKIWSIIGLVGIIILIYIEFALINAVCIYCTIAHIIGILIFLLILKL